MKMRLQTITLKLEERWQDDFLKLKSTFTNKFENAAWENHRDKLALHVFVSVFQMNTFIDFWSLTFDHNVASRNSVRQPARLPNCKTFYLVSDINKWPVRFQGSMSNWSMKFKRKVWDMNYEHLLTLNLDFILGIT